MSTESQPLQNPSKSKRRIVAGGVLLAGLLVLGTLVLTRPTASKKPVQSDGVLVEVMTIEKVDHIATVEAHGEVIPSQEVELQPQVGGRVTWISEDLVPGGLLKEGTDILKIDPRDYQLMVEQQGAAVERAKLDLELEKGRKVVAEKEWELLKKGEEEGAGPSSLVLREPHMRTAEVALKSAESSLRRAWLDLSRTTLEAPFNAVVVTESVNAQQVVTPQTKMARLVGTDAFWIQVSIPVDELAWIRAPGPGQSSNEGSVAEIFYDLRGGTHQREGQVVRLLGDLDPAGRMARLLVEVKDPYGFEQEKPTLPLLLGAYVRLEIRGEEVPQVAELPRRAIHDGDTVHVMQEEGTLEVRQISIVRRGSDRVWVSAGLEDGEKVVTTKLNAPMPGMKLRVADVEPKPEEPAVAAESLD